MANTTVSTPAPKADRANVVLKATVSLRVLSSAPNLAKFKIEMDRLCSQYFAHGLYRIETKAEEMEF